MWVKEKHISKIALNTWYAKFEFMAMPFRFTNTYTTFKLTIDNFPWYYFDEFEIIYLDDIIIYSKIKAKHLKHVKKVLKKLANHRLYKKP